MSQAVANRYANALAEVLLEAGDHEAASAALDQLRSFDSVYQESRELENVLESPAVPGDQKRDLIRAIGERIGVSESIRNLLFVLSDNRRLDSLAEVADAFERLVDESRGIARIRVTSAAALDDDHRQAIVQKFEVITGKPIEADFKIDSELLGGVIVRAGGKVYDGSLSSQLRALDRAMAGQA